MYLGASLSADGRVDSEVARRIGAARADFRALQRVWAHASLAVKDKVRIYDACVVSSLTYGLQTAWLSVAARRRLDGFHAKCSRRICNILPSFISRVPNAEVLARAGCSMKLSTRIRVQQLVLAGRCAAAPVGTPMREALQQSVGRPGRRNRGRPRRHGRPTSSQRLWQWLVPLTSCRPPRPIQPSGGGKWSNTARGHMNHERPAGQWVRSAGPHTVCVCF